MKPAKKRVILPDLKSLYPTIFRAYYFGPTVIAFFCAQMTVEELFKFSCKIRNHSSRVNILSYSITASRPWPELPCTALCLSDTPSLLSTTTCQESRALLTHFDNYWNPPGFRSPHPPYSCIRLQKDLPEDLVHSWPRLPPLKGKCVFIVSVTSKIMPQPR